MTTSNWVGLVTPALKQMFVVVSRGQIVDGENRNMRQTRKKTYRKFSIAIAASTMTVTLMVGVMFPVQAKSRRTTAPSTCKLTYTSKGRIFVPLDGRSVSVVNAGGDYGSLLCDFPSDSYLSHDDVEKVLMYGTHWVGEPDGELPEARLCISSTKGQNSVVCGRWKLIPHEGLGTTRASLRDVDILSESGRSRWFPSISVRGMTQEAYLYGFEIRD